MKKLFVFALFASALFFTACNDWFSTQVEKVPQVVNPKLYFVDDYYSPNREVAVVRWSPPVASNDWDTAWYDGVIIEIEDSTKKSVERQRVTDPELVSCEFDIGWINPDETYYLTVWTVSTSGMLSDGEKFTFDPASMVTITYNGNGNTKGSPPPMEYVYKNEPHAVAGFNNLQKGDPGNVKYPDHWSKTADTDGTPYDASKDYNPGDEATFDDNTTLYAIWPAN